MTAALFLSYVVASENLAQNDQFDSIFEQLTVEKGGEKFYYPAYD